MASKNEGHSAGQARPGRSLFAQMVESRIRSSLGDIPGGLDAYELPLGDPGLFGPDSMAWKVHGDLPSMLIGGFCALMIQMLHPLAMAGVHAHSRFREDPLGRLQRTGRFIAGTTYGSMPLVGQLVEEVHAVHARVQGTAPNGRRYSAADPELLRFVHVSELWSFLAAYQRYSLHPLLRHEKDQYFVEMAVVGELLGATDVPVSLDEARSYLRDIEPELCKSEQTDEAMAFLGRPVTSALADVAAHRLILAAATDLMPPRLQRLLGLEPAPWGSGSMVRTAASAFSLCARWALGPSPVVTRARHRATADVA